MMEAVNWINLIVSILSGVAVCIPLVIKLVDTIKCLVQEKNWAKLVEEIYALMSEAEEKYVTGAEKKEFVMGMVEAAARSANYDYDDDAKEKVSRMIDDTCTLAKQLVKIDK